MGPRGKHGEVTETASSGISSSLDILQQLSVLVAPRSSLDNCMLIGEPLSRTMVASGGSILPTTDFSLFEVI